MNINFEKMGNNEALKICKLIDTSIKFGWDNYYTLFIDLGNDLMACKTDYETGEEDIIEVDNMSWHDLERWGNQPILKVV